MFAEFAASYSFHHITSSLHYLNKLNMPFKLLKRNSDNPYAALLTFCINPSTMVQLVLSATPDGTILAHYFRGPLQTTLAIL